MLMKRLIILLLVVCLSQVAVHSQANDYARYIVDTLASSAFFGRGYVNDGVNLSAEFLAQEFEKTGLKKVKRKYEQGFNIKVNTFPGEMILKINETELIAGKEYLVDPLSSGINGHFEAVVVQKEELKDPGTFKNIVNTSAGKFIILDERNYVKESAEEDKKLIEYVNFIKYNTQLASRGTIILTSEKLVWSPANVQLSKPVFIVSKEMELKNPTSVAVHVDAQFQEKFRTKNVIGIIEGKEIPDSFIVLTAHYDHLGMMGKEVYFPGANDNASGVAMLLSLAKYYMQNPPAYSVVFIALAAEEVGLLGAKHFVQYPLIDLGKIKFLLNFDLAGTGDDGIKVVNGSVYRDKFDLLTDLNEQHNYLSSINIRGEACISDHCMFYNKGVPCFYIYTLGGISEYHNIYDRAETLPLTEFADYKSLMIDFIVNLH